MAMFDVKLTAVILGLLTEVALSAAHPNWRSALDCPFALDARGFSAAVRQPPAFGIRLHGLSCPPSLLARDDAPRHPPPPKSWDRSLGSGWKGLSRGLKGSLQLVKNCSFN